MRHLLWIAVLSLAACRSDAPKPAVSTPAAQTPAPVPPSEATAGSAFNKLFPAATGDAKLVFAQEKDGFALADLSIGGKKVAALSISDTASNPSARDKFKAASKRIGGYPVAASGSQGTALLVADRYQVQIRSSDPSFTAADREAWIAKFPLTQLAALASKK